MHRRVALKTMASTVLAIAGCQSVAPEVELEKIEYWDDFHRRWIQFERIELSNEKGVISCSNGILFNLKSEHYCFAIRGNYNLFVPLAKENHDKKYFFESVCKKTMPYERDHKGNFYEIINTDFNTTNLLYM